MGTHLQTLRIIILAKLLIGTLVAHCQPDIEWQSCFGGTMNDEAMSIAQASDGGFIMAGHVRSSNGNVIGYHGGAADAWVVKLDSDGTIQWQRCLGGSRGDYAASVHPTVDGGYIMAGSTFSNNGDVNGYHESEFSLSDAWVVKLSAMGMIEWQRCLGGSSEDYLQSIQELPEGGYVAAGASYSNNGDVTCSNGGSWVVKLNTMGDILWNHCVSLGGRANSIKCTLDGGYILGGLTTPNNIEGGCLGLGIEPDSWVAKLDAQGEVQWQRCLGGSESDGVFDVQQTSDGGYILSNWARSNDGDVTDNHGGQYDAWIVKLDDLGGIEWQKCFGGSGAEYAHAIQQDNDGGFLIAGATSSSDGDIVGNHGYGDVWMFKIDATGIIDWQMYIGGTMPEYAKAMQQTMDGGYVLAGFTGSNTGDVSGNHGGDDCWVVKLGAGQVGITGGTPYHYTITPNPTNSTLTLGFAVNTEPRQAIILDATGRKVAAQRISATGPVTLDLSGHENGLYIVQILFADATLTVERILKE